MATPIPLDAPPAQPPQVQAGGPAGPPMAGVGGMMAKQSQQGMEGKGMVVSATELVIKSLDKIGQMSPMMASFCARAQAIMKAGLEQMAGEKGGVQTEEPQPGQPAGSNQPGGVGAGGGFPG